MESTAITGASPGTREGPDAAAELAADRARGEAFDTTANGERTDWFGAEAGDYSLVNLTRLSWQQPLVASVRLCLSSGEIPSAWLLAPDGSQAGDDAVRRASRGSGSPGARARTPDGSSAALPAQLLDSQRDLVDRACWELRDWGRSRAGAAVAVLLTELGWPVNRVADALRASRPTLNKWTMVEAGRALSRSERAELSAALAGGAGSRTAQRRAADSGAASKPGRDEPAEAGVLLDVRSSALRTERSCASWQRVAVLPAPGAVLAMRALWRVSYHSRGRKSGQSERVCSHALDAMLELCLRRGATGFSVSQLAGVVHPSVSSRAQRYRTAARAGALLPGEPDVPALCGTAALLGRAAPAAADGADRGPRAYAPAGSNTGAEGWFSVAQRRRPCGSSAPDGEWQNVLLRSKSHPPSPANPTPLPVLSLLCVPALPDSASSAELAELLEELHSLDQSATGGAPSRLRATVRRARAAEFAPLRVTADPGRAAAAQAALLDALSDGERALPLADPDAVAAVWGVDRCSPPDQAGHRSWTDGDVFGEAQLVRAAAARQRGAGRASSAAARRADYYWLPAELLSSRAAEVVVHTELQAAQSRVGAAADALAASLDPERGGSPLARGQLLVDGFVPPAVADKLAEWMSETSPGAGEPSLLERCLRDPASVLSAYSPSRRARSAAENGD